MRRAPWLSLPLIACAGSPSPPPSIAEADAPEAVAAAVCGAEHDCACPDTAWPDRETCADAEILALEDSASIAADHGLVYDGECVARRVQAYADAQCDPEVPLAPCSIACKPYVGPDRDGDACERLAITVDVDTCAQGLRCEQGTCLSLCDPTPPSMEGAVCAEGIVAVATCDSALYCASDTGRCAPRPGAGEACPDTVCVASAYCDRSDASAPVCLARLPAGEPCLVDAQCESDLCAAEACAAPAAAACSFRDP